MEEEWVLSSMQLKLELFVEFTEVIRAEENLETKYTNSVTEGLTLQWYIHCIIHMFITNVYSGYYLHKRTHRGNHDSKLSYSLHRTVNSTHNVC